MRLGVEAEPFLVSPNQSEAEALVGQEFHDEEDFRLALDSIAEMGARNVLITTEDGCVALLREEREIAPPACGRAEGRAALDRRLGRRAARRLPGSPSRRPLRRGVAACRGRRRRRVDARGRSRPLRPAARGPLAGRRRGQRARARPEPGLTLIRRPRYPLPDGRRKARLRPFGNRAPGEVREGRADVRRRAPRAGRVVGAAERRLDRDPLHAHRRARGADRLRGDGHRHRGAARDRARARGRPRDRAPQPLDRGAGRRGRQGQALRGRDDRRAGDAAARRARLRRGRPDGALPHLRRADHERRGPARRHPHEPRPALRAQPRAAASPS